MLATIFAVPLLGERVRIATLVAFGLAFAGTALLVGAVPTGAPTAGVVLALASAAMFGLYVVLARRWGARYRLDGTLITIANLIGRGPVLLMAALVLDPAAIIPTTPDPAAVIALLTIVFGSSTSGNLLLMASVRRVPAGRASAALLLTPVASAVIAAVALGERLSPGGVLGAALILAGMAVASGLSASRNSRSSDWFDAGRLGMTRRYGLVRLPTGNPPNVSDSVTRNRGPTHFVSGGHNRPHSGRHTRRW